MSLESSGENEMESVINTSTGERATYIKKIGFYLALSGVAMLPFIVFQTWIKQLFWFGDDFAFISDVHRYGIASWLAQQFGENYIPLFKTYWIVIFLGGGGSSALAIGANWVIHAFNTVLLARLLTSANFSKLAAATCAAAFGIAAANVEVLTWSMGGATIIACTFLLLALQSEIGRCPASWKTNVGTAAAIFAGTLAHARGIVAGPALAAMAIFDDSDGKRSLFARTGRASFFLLPCVVTGVVIFLKAPDNHQGVLGSATLALRALRFAGWYLAADPVLSLLGANGKTWTFFALTTFQVISLGLVKAGLMVISIRGSDGKRRILLIGLIVADLCTAGLLGLGRSFGEPTLAMSSRYQYGSLICTLPILAAAGATVFSQHQRLFKNSRAVLWAGLIGIIGLNLHLWNNLLPNWTAWRGLGTRIVLDSSANPEGRDLPGADFISNEDARILAKHYDLH